ncbi:hypothetical protein [Hymenobacter weizhouensis]|uniref:hypothetical protein n=1 Tax=Hymenobacter sp. YIM 151500-1 TaxID=2987689 RepID=UPI0022271D89|nr:hypothetical protein [Hymenobacter sp. YIM 151500-1]UYZ61855.1 hypothetical protein OIS53_12680 [Hymenobacter sp. YIM 151500-1]
MTLTPTLRLRPLLLFGLLLAAGVGVELLIIRRPDFATQPLLPAAVSFDVLVLPPLLFYLLVVRPYRLPVSTVAGAFAAAVALGYWLLPVSQQQYLGWARHGLVAVEALVFGLLITNLRRIRRAFRAARLVAAGYVEALDEAVRPVFGRLTAPVVMEVSTVYYAFLSWRARPEVQTTDVVFTTHQESAFTALMSTVALLSVAEMGAAHLLLMRWQPLVAWVALGLHLYGLMVLVAHVRAVRLRPMLLTQTGELVLRTGFLWQLRLPVADVEAIDSLTEAPPRAPGLLNLAQALLTPPNVLLTLRCPHEAVGPYGVRRSVSRVALYLDQPAGLRAALASASTSSNGSVFGNKP